MGSKHRNVSSASNMAKGLALREGVDTLAMVRLWAFIMGQRKMGL
jgi:hypothetical protein